MIVSAYAGSAEPRVRSIWVVVPLSRPDRLPEVVKNFAQQRFDGKQLCIVENGAAVGACAAQGVRPELLLESESNPARARNRALAELKRRGCGYWVAMDDDDWYGPEYLSEHAGLAAPGQIVGKYTHWVSCADTDLLLFNAERASQSARWVNAGTIGGYVEESPEFPDVPCGEEEGFCGRVLEAGGKVWASSPFHTCYRRLELARHPHTFRVEFDQFCYLMGEAWLFRRQAQTEQGLRWQCGLDAVHCSERQPRMQRYTVSPSN